jgi:small-conductance mechanosensitive channel
MRAISVRIVVALVLIVAVGLIAGCTDQTAELNEALSRADEATELYNQLDAEIADLLEQALATPDTAEGGEEMIALVAEAQAKLEEQRAALATARGAYESITEMDVSEDAQAYAAKQVEIVDSLEQTSDLYSEVLELWNELGQMMASGNVDEARAAEMDAEMQALIEEVVAIDAEVAALAAEADALYEAASTE